MLSSIWSEIYSFLKGCRSISLGLQLRIPTHEVRGELWLCLTYSECAPSLKTGLKVIHVNRKPWLLQGPFWNTFYMMFIVLHISISIFQPKLDILCVRIVPMEVAIGRQINVELAFFIVVFFSELYGSFAGCSGLDFWHQLPAGRFLCQQKLDEGG